MLVGDDKKYIIRRYNRNYYIKAQHQLRNLIDINETLATYHQSFCHGMV